uniref:Uncharacterized protein AlNc14C29G2743 n=1 Tax=Albugo laibachii Nc14 TaxID=890382 RepID=F0W7C3_9STRA|nr:conserved hypothetical protein [Albugo laibachii Nc14]|eukprot:CCA17022.1 conserved hypothetical protein [Albugo laibachii Nc14]
MTRSGKRPERQPLRNAQESFTPTQKQKVLDVLSACDNISVFMNAFYPDLPGRTFDSRMKLIYKWRKEAAAIQFLCRTARLAQKEKQRDLGTATILSASCEQQLVVWVNDLRAESVPISSTMLQLQALEIGEKNGIGNFRATPSWQKLFKRRHKFSMRASTRQGQKTPEDSSLIAVQFGELVRRTAQELGVSKIFNAYQSGNCFSIFICFSDVVSNIPKACFYEYLPKRTLAKTGEKTVWVRCSGKEKERATVMLLGDSNGGKYAPTVVFKAKRSVVEETAQENLRVRHGFGRKVWKEVRAIEDATGLSIFGNTTAWWNESLQLQFLAQHFAQRPDMSQAVLLLLDDFSGPVSAKVVAYAKEINVVVLKVPPRFTSVCQTGRCELDEAIQGQDAWPVDRLPETSDPRETAANDDRVQDEESHAHRHCRVD